MGIPSEMRDFWAKRRETLLIPSPVEERKISNARHCTQEGVRAGFKAACIACVVTAVPTLFGFNFSGVDPKFGSHRCFFTFGSLSCKGRLTAVRVVPWAKANLNYTAQALIISAASIAAYFITADKTILECARRNSQFDEALRRQS